MSTTRAKRSSPSLSEARSGSVARALRAAVSAWAAGEKSGSSPRSTMTRRAIARRRPRLDRSVIRSFDQAVELPRVLADDLVRHLGGQMAELLLDVLGGFRPHPIAVRIVGAPHEGLHADVVDELGADAVELEGRLALPAPVVGWLHLEPEIVEAVLPLEIHAIQRVRQPADAALAEGDAEVRIALEHRAADHRGQDIDEVHLEARHAGEQRGALGESGGLLAHAGRHGG